jgi:probable HAF family extracellular repeat protein
MVWENGQMHDLNHFLPAGSGWQRLGEANDINDSGQIVGWGVLNGQFHAFRASDPDGVYANGGLTIVDLGTLPGGRSSAGAAINSNGQTVGASEIRQSGVVHAFLHANGMMTDLKTLGGSNSWAKGINAAQQAVGAAQFQRNGLAEHAFQWQEGKMTDLNRLLPRGSGWTLTTANDINNLGWIVGTGAKSGQGHAFLLVPGGLLMQAGFSGAASIPEALRGDWITTCFDQSPGHWQGASVGAGAFPGTDSNMADHDGGPVGLTSVDSPGNQVQRGRVVQRTDAIPEVGRAPGDDRKDGGLMAHTWTSAVRLGPGHGQGLELSLLVRDAIFSQLGHDADWVWIDAESHGHRSTAN